MRVLQSWSQSSSLHGLIKALQAAIHSGEAAQYSADVLFVVRASVNGLFICVHVSLRQLDVETGSLDMLQDLSS